MTSERRVALVCDKCGAEESGACVSAIEARREAARCGWLRVRDDIGWADVCPDCALPDRGKE